MAYDKQNIFAKILRKEVPSDFLYEDDFVVAFRDIHPKAATHVLVITKEAYEDFNDFMAHADKEEIIGVWTAVKKIAEQLDVIAAGYRLVVNDALDRGRKDHRHHRAYRFGQVHHDETAQRA